MKFSFIVATYKRNRELENCLASIEKVYLRKKKYEVEAVVVFQAGEQPLENMAQRFSAFGKFHCIQGKGLAKARNYAVKTSTGDIFIFLDDDAEIKEDFVEILAEHAQNNETGAFSGRILEKQTNRCFAECFNDTRVKRLRCRDFKYFMGSAHVFRKEVFVK
ncbi:MAG: glycosyltransferase, partial [Candidatus Omnitrophica bacterium]|nr:glycosyltransferase [Candidatus Omnitrophota bacterium]